jgi:hypothetical protein
LNKNVENNIAKYPQIKDWIIKNKDDSLTVLSGKVEIGQGILFALRMLVSDEFGLPLSQIKIFNARTDTHPNEAVTSGSLSIQDSGLTLKIVCLNILALTREVFLFKNKFADADVRFDNGTFFHVNEHSERLIDLINTEILQKNINLSNQLISYKKNTGSQNLINYELLQKVDGTYEFINDIEIDNMLFGIVLHPKTLLGKINLKSFEIFKDKMQRKFNNLQIYIDGNLIGILGETKYQLLIIEKEIDAYNLWNAENIDVAMNSQYDQWLKSQKSNVNVLLDKSTGNNMEGLVEKTIHITRPYITHASVGLCCAFSTWKKDAVEVISHSQGIFNLRRDLALAFNKPEAEFIVIHHPGAGCYGHNGADDVAYDAVWLSRFVPNRAVRVEWSRSQEMTLAPLSPAMSVTVSASVDQSAKLVSWDQEIWSQAHGTRPGRDKTPALLGAWQTANPFPVSVPINAPVTNGGGADRNSKPIYLTKSIKVTVNDIVVMPNRVSALRSLGAHINVVAIESMMDELASTVPMDPLKFRLNNLDNARAIEVLKKINNMSRWEDLKTVKKEGVGIGLGFAQYKNTGAYCAVVAEVFLSETIEIQKLFICADVGSIVNFNGVINQLEGGAVQAISFTNFEETKISSCGIQSNDWSKYPIIGFENIPKIETQLIENSQYPSVGAGECSVGPTAGAITNAVYDAIGFRLRNMPFNIDNLRKEILSSD